MPGPPLKRIEKQSFIYSFKIWLTTSLLAPIFVTLLHFYFLSVNNLRPFHDPSIYNRELLRLIKALAGGCVLLVPMGLGLYYSVILLNKRLPSLSYIKIYLSVIGIVLANLAYFILLFNVLWTNIESGLRTLTVISIFHAMACYTVAALTSIWFYKLKPVENAPPILN